MLGLSLQFSRVLRAHRLGRFDQLQLLTIVIRHLSRLAVAGDHPWGDQHDQLGAVLAFTGVTEQPAQARDVAQVGHGGDGIAVVLFDQASEQHRLPALYSYLGGHRAGGDARVAVAVGAAGAVGVADLLLDVHVHQAARIDARHHIEDDPGLHVFDAAQGGVRGVGVDCGLSDRDVVADLDLRLLVIHHHQRRGRQHLGAAAGFHGMQGDLQVAADKGVEQRVRRTQAGTATTQRALAAGAVGHGAAGGITGQAAEVPLHP